MPAADFTQRAGLVLDIAESTQYATLYRDGVAIATLQRRRVYAKGPAWRAYDLDGREVWTAAHSLPAATMARRVAAALDKREANKRAALAALTALAPLDAIDSMRAALRVQSDAMNGATHWESQLALGRASDRLGDAAQWIKGDDSRAKQRKESQS